MVRYTIDVLKVWGADRGGGGGGGGGGRGGGRAGHMIEQPEMWLHAASILDIGLNDAQVLSTVQENMRGHNFAFVRPGIGTTAIMIRAESPSASRTAAGTCCREVQGC